MGYVTDTKGVLVEKFYQAKKNGTDEVSLTKSESSLIMSSIMAGTNFLDEINEEVEKKLNPNAVKPEDKKPTHYFEGL